MARCSRGHAQPRSASKLGSLVSAALHLPVESCVRDPGEAARVRAFLAAPQGVADYAWGVRLIETGEAFLASRIDRTALTPEIADVYERIGVHSLLVTALRVRGESIGTLGPTPPSERHELRRRRRRHASPASTRQRT
jgi:hypothetical protein